MVETWRILPAQILGSARVSRAGDGVLRHRELFLRRLIDCGEGAAIGTRGACAPQITLRRAARVFAHLWCRAPPSRARKSDPAVRRFVSNFSHASPSRALSRAAPSPLVRQLRPPF